MEEDKEKRVDEEQRKTREHGRKEQKTEKEEVVSADRLERPPQDDGARRVAFPTGRISEATARKRHHC